MAAPGSRASGSSADRSRASGSRAIRSAVGGAKVVELLNPGSFVQLRDHPEDLPPFQLIRRCGSRCWVRQQAWGPLVQLELPYRRLRAVP